MESIRINDGRMRKRERQHIHSEYNNITPPKYILKQSKINMIPKYKKDMGYDYFLIGERGGRKITIQPTKEMKWEKQEFEYATDKLLGRHLITKKMTNKDKWKLKEELGVSISKNKYKVLEKMEKTINRQLLIAAMGALIKFSK